MAVASATIAAIDSDGDSPKYYSKTTVNYFDSGSIVITGLTGDCYVRLRASEKAMSSSPGAFSAWYSGKLDENDDKLLEAYGHHWYLTTASRLTYSNLPDGYYMFTASCTTPYTASEDYMFKIDTARPTTTISPRSDYDPAPKTHASYTFDIVVADVHGSSPVYNSMRAVTTKHENDGVSYKWRVDSGSWHEPKTSVPSGMTDALVLGYYEAGPHCLEVKGIDVAGNEEKYYAHYCWTVETFTKTTGCSFVYSLNHAEYVSTEDSHASVTNLPDGTNSFVVKAVDMYGHETTEDYKNTFTWTVDTQLPVATLTQTWSETEVVTSTKGTFKYTSSETNSFFKYQVDGGVVVTAPTATTQSFPTGTFNVESCAGTTHTFSVMAIDPVGNVGTAATDAFTVEPINTDLAVANAAEGSVIPSTTAVFSIAAVVDNSAPDSFAYEYSLNSGAWTRGRHFPRFGLRGLPEGTHTLQARAITAGGCVDPTPASVTFTIDVTPPMVSFLGCEERVLTNSSHATLCGSVADANIKTTGAQYRIGTAPYSPMGNPLLAADGAFCIQMDGLIEGMYEIEMKATDRAGLTGDMQTCEVVVDAGPPDTAIEYGPATPAKALMDGAYFFGLTCTEASCTFEYSLDEQPPMLVIPKDKTPNLFALNISADDVSLGMHTLKATAIDAAGNMDPSPAYFSFALYSEAEYTKYSENFAWSFNSAASGGMTPQTFKFTGGLDRIYFRDG